MNQVEPAKNTTLTVVMSLDMAERLRDLLMACGRAGDYERLSAQMPTRLAPFNPPLVRDTETGYDPTRFVEQGRKLVPIRRPRRVW